MKTDNLSESEYDLTSDYQTTQEENIFIRNNKNINNNLSNSNLIDYSTLNCTSCQEKTELNNFSFLLITVPILIILIIYCFFKKKF